MKKLVLATILYFFLTPGVNAEDFNIQAAIDAKSASGGGTVTIPKGTFTLDKTVQLKSNVHLQGAGEGKTVLKIQPKKADGSSNPDKVVSIDRADNSELSDLTIDGEKDKRKDLINSGNTHAMDIAWSSNWKIHDVEIKNAVDGSIVTWNAKNGTIEDNSIKDSGSNGILLMEKTENVKVLNNKVNKTDNENGIFVMYQSVSADNVKIEGNEVTDSADYGIEVGHTTQKPEDAPHKNISIKDNKVINSVCAGVGLRTVSDAVVENNEITGYGKVKGYGCNGIFVEGRVSLNKNVDLKGNKITQTFVKATSDDSTPYNQAIYITGMRDMNVTGNVIDNSWSESIKVLASWFTGSTPDFPNGRRIYENIKVENNTIKNSELNSVYFDDYKTAGNSIKGNKIKGHGIEINKNPGVEVSDNTIDPLTDPPQEDPPSTDGGEWKKPTSFNPLPKYFPSTNRQTLTPGQYTITFDARSAKESVLTTYIQDKRILNEELKLTNDYKSYSYSFTLLSGNEILLWDRDAKKDIEIKNIKITKVDPVPNEPKKPEPEEPKRDKSWADLITKMDAFFEKNEDKAKKVVNVFSSILDLVTE